mmetsp:Transcript_74877/g.132227  ORF Transcript_74877/g.132227 Transcript_74877/m.132227 type:complete len:242 (+) Transcript_74877:116-841(+)
MWGIYGSVGLGGRGGRREWQASKDGGQGRGCRLDSLVKAHAGAGRRGSGVDVARDASGDAESGIRFRGGDREGSPKKRGKGHAWGTGSGVATCQPTTSMLDGTWQADAADLEGRKRVGVLRSVSERSSGRSHSHFPFGNCTCSAPRYICRSERTCLARFHPILLRMRVHTTGCSQDRHRHVPTHTRTVPQRTINFSTTLATTKYTLVGYSHRSFHSFAEERKYKIGFSLNESVGGGGGGSL